ncbi:WD40/YVTN repeat-like-containing domain superfamily [Sesbania bispinosa]|nr:WD40/YVTN repeat-like-containing domain superfamily [Sesbania bispinosa]
MHQPGENSTSKLEWKSSPDPFIFGSFESMDLPPSLVTLLNCTPSILSPNTVGIQSKPIERPRILADVSKSEVFVPAVTGDNEWEEPPTDVAITESEVQIRGGSREQRQIHQIEIVCNIHYHRIIGDDGPAEAINLFRAVTHRLHKISDLDMAAKSRPDTVACNAAFNACANSGDGKMFLQLFDEMPQCGVMPDALSFNITMKLCCRIDRKGLLVVVLERILQLNIPLCMTTLHSLVAAYVDFSDLETAEKMVQTMKQKGRDPCRILRESNSQYLVESDDSVFHKLLPNLMNHKLLKETAEKMIQPEVVSNNILFDGCILVDDSTRFQGIMMAYTSAPLNISLAGPTLFGPVISNVALISNQTVANVGDTLGCLSTLARDVSFAGVMVMFYEALKDVAECGKQRWALSPNWHVDNSFEGLDLGGLAGGLGAYFTTSLDVFKTRLQVQGSTLRYPHSICFGQRFTFPCIGIKTCGESSRNLYVVWKYSVIFPLKVMSKATLTFMTIFVVLLSEYVVESFTGHQYPLTLAQSFVSGETQLLLSSSCQGVRLWDASSILIGTTHSFEGYKAAGFSNDGNVPNVLKFLSVFQVGIG